MTGKGGQDGVWCRCLHMSGLQEYLAMSELDPPGGGADPCGNAVQGNWIPGNTGSIARTCAAAAVGLHLVGGHDTWDEFRDYFMQQDGDKRLLAFTKRGTNIHSDFSYKPGDWLVFGSETKGLPESALEDCSGEALGGGTIRIPMVETYVRCLNLSVSVGVALYEAARQLNYEQLQYQPDLPEEAQGLFPAEDIYG